MFNFLVAISDLPDGIFKTLIVMWESLSRTYVKVVEWLGETAFTDDGTGLTALIGSTLFFVLGWTIFKWFNPFH